MAALAKALSRASGATITVETLKTALVFCGVGLLAWLLSYGLDMIAGFF